MWLLIGLIAWPLAEIALFIEIGGWLGVWLTLFWVVTSAVIGLNLMRGQGLRTATEVQQSLTNLRDPAIPVAHGALVMLAGVLLIIPGFLSDALGGLLLIPAMQRLMLSLVIRRTHQGRYPPSDIINASYSEVDDVPEDFDQGDHCRKLSHHSQDKDRPKH